jgi:multidrug efflux system outer membrane protein
MKVWRAALAILAFSFAGCAGLPSKPQPVVLPADAPLSAADAGGGGQWPSAQWWKRYQDPTLDRLIALAMESSPTLATVHARFDSARQSVRLAGAAAGASVEASADFTRQRLSDNGLFPPSLLGFNWYNVADLGLHASYTFDWWGKQRASVEAAMDEAHAAEADRRAAALVLASSIADAYFGWQADQCRLALAEERLAAVQREGVIAAARVRAELDAADSLHRTDGAAAAIGEQIAGLDGSAKLRIVALAALAGRSAADLPALEAKPLPPLAGRLPDNVRLDLIARRADITASRWRVEAAERNLDAARAEFFPDVSINALLGLSSIDVGKLIEYGSRVPQAGAAIHLPLFDSGRLKARYGANQVLIQAAVAAYQETLVNAARDVATEASTAAEIAVRRSQRVIELDAARQLRVSAAARVRQGITDYRPELTATESWIEQRDALLQLDAAALSADIGLQRALGGGYESAQDLTNANPISMKATP